MLPHYRTETRMYQLARRLDAGERVAYMKRITSQIRSLWQDESGPTAVEYGVLLALIVVVAIAAITLLGRNAEETFNRVSESIESESSS